MKQIKETLDQAKMITGFIYNSLKVVNLMKVFTKDRDLLRPGITRFATEFISLESLLRYEADLKRMCTTNEWREFNKDRSKKSLRDKVSNFILTDRFWKKVEEVQTIMEPLIKVLKLIDQDKKPTLSIIYEAMDRANLAIKAYVKQWEKYWEVIDRRWEGQLHKHLHTTDEWIREGEESILSSDNLDWLDKGLPTNEEGRERDVDSRRKGKASKTISSSFSSDDGDNRGSKRGGGTSGGNRGVGGTSEGIGGDGNTGGGYVSQVDPGMSRAQGEGYSNIGTRASDSYGYDQSSSSSSIAYRDFGYYQYGIDPEQPLKPYFPDYGSSSQSSHPTYSSYEQLLQPYPHYGNCHPNLYTRRRTDDDDDFEPLRHSTWN
ncbi:hypothetical protein CK203_028397 [Vitis vinifera]|uniref:DUF659 domain-containing protein n=1 Tax=Vitis vinifera TaxID=29760 RepID=A0A438J044_VITVI|nr:hypothetical protein CK203_028397 [Vitis vinifera]